MKCTFVHFFHGIAKINTREIQLLNFREIANKVHSLQFEPENVLNMFLKLCSIVF